MARTEGSTLGASPSLIGREEQLKIVDSTLHRVAGGDGLALLISGPIGIGKSRLASELVRLARGRGFNVSRGAAYPSDASLAYAPIIEGLGRSLRELEPPEQAKLLRNLEALGLLFPDVIPAAAQALRDPALEKTRLYESVARLVDRMSRSKPMLLSIDDLHWADPATLDLIGYLGRDIASFPLLLVGTYSVEYFGESPSLGTLLQTLRRAGQLREISLTTLTSEETGALIAETLAGRITTRDAAIIFDQTQGNPLFTVALLHELVAAGALVELEGSWTLHDEAGTTVPRVADDILTERLHRLEASERHLVELLAVGGGEVSHSVLESVVDIREPDLTKLIRRLLLDGLVIAQDRGRLVTYRCSHPLLARVAYTHMSPGARRQAHVAFIDAIEGKPQPDWERLAWHYQHAADEVDQQRRLRVLIETGQRALDAYANDIAIEALEAAHELAIDLGISDDIVSVLESLGEAQSRSGHDHAATSAWEQALEIRLVQSDERSAVRLHRKLASAESNLGRFESADEHVAKGLGILGEDVTEEDIELMAVAALNHFRRGDLPAASVAVDEIEDAAATLNSARSELMASLLRVGVLLENAEHARVMAPLVRSLEIARATGDPVSEQLALSFRALVNLTLGHLAQLHGDLDANYELTDRMGIPLREYRIRLYEFALAVYSGNWETADEVAVDALSTTERLDMSRNRVVVQVMPVMLHAYRGDYELAETRLEVARRSLATAAPADNPTSTFVDIMAALLDLERGRPKDALRTLEGLHGYFLLGLLPPWGPYAWAESLARCGDPRAGEAAADLAALGAKGTLPEAWAHRIRALEAEAADDAASAVAHFRSAADSFKSLGLPFEAARSTLEQAEALAGATSAEAMRASYETFVELGARPYADRTAQLLRTVGETVPRPTRRRTSGLTPRQTEVARLVAEGLSNAEIGDRLFISHRTVTTHMENIYQELGLSSRTALTRYVVERGLLERAETRDT